MPDLSAFPITARWAAQHQGRLLRAVSAWLDRALAPPDVERGLLIPQRPA